MNNENVDTTNVITKTNLGVVTASAEEMDKKRENSSMLAYLEKLDAARNWICDVTGLSLPLTDFIAELPKGEILASIVKVYEPETVIYMAPTREYRHTDNINAFLAFIRRMKLSRHFHFEVFDLYSAKDIPLVIFCIHGLAHFMSARKLSAPMGSSHKSFTKEEEELAKTGHCENATHCYEDISNRLDSEDSETRKRVTFSTNLATEHFYEAHEQDDGLCVQANKTSEDKSIKEKNIPFMQRLAALRTEDAAAYEQALAHCHQVRRLADALNWREAFGTLVAKAQVPIRVLRKFIFLAPFVQEDTAQLVAVNRGIIRQFKVNYALQQERDSILRSVRLLHENQCRLRGIAYQESPAANDYTAFKTIIYKLVHNHALLLSVIRDGFELPFSVLFPDNKVGDYHFSRFICHAAAVDRPLARKLAAWQFMASRTFRNLTQLFSDEKNVLLAVRDDANGRKHKYSFFDMNPIEVNEYLYAAMPKVSHENQYNRRALLDTAIKDVAVREEIARRAKLIMQYADERIDYLAKLELPYYARSFLADDSFFEEFIEPSILLGNNFIIAELIKNIFYNRRFFLTPKKVFAQERLTYYNCEFDRTTKFDLSDYGPLREWMENPTNSSLYYRMVDRNITVREGDAFGRFEADMNKLKENSRIMDEKFKNTEDDYDYEYDLDCSADSMQAAASVIDPVTAELRFDQIKNPDISELNKPPVIRVIDVRAVLPKLEASAINDFFMRYHACDEMLRIEVSLEEVNNIIIVLKESIRFMDGSLHDLVDSIELMRQPPVPARFEVKYERSIQEASIPAPVIMNGEPVDAVENVRREVLSSNRILTHGSTKSFVTVSQTGKTYLVDAETGQSPKGINSKVSSKYNSKYKAAWQSQDLLTQRFILSLDTEFDGLDYQDEQVAFDTLIASVKRRLCFLISISSETTLAAILNRTCDSERLLFNRMFINQGKDEEIKNLVDKEINNETNNEIDTFKLTLSEDLDFLVSRGYLAKSIDILPLIARDIARQRQNRIDSSAVINVETLDALFKKGCLLKEELESFYVYFSSYIERMAINRSGRFFNRQQGTKTRYGTYKYDGAKLCDLQSLEKVDLEDFDLWISMDKPLLFDLQVIKRAATGSANGVLARQCDIRFDELLRLQDDGIELFELGGTMVCGVNALVGIINDQYIRAWE